MGRLVPASPPPGKSILVRQHHTSVRLMCLKSIDTRFRQDAANRSERRLTTPDDNSWGRRNRAGPQPCILTDLVDPPEATTPAAN